MGTRRRRVRVTNYKLEYSTKPTKVVLLAVKRTVEKEPTLTKEEIGLLKFEQNLKRQVSQFKSSVNGQIN